MRKPRVENKYKLTMQKLKKAYVVDRSQVKEPLFWRNNVVDAWCITGTTAKDTLDSTYGTYNGYWIGIYDEDAKHYKGRVRFSVHAYGGMETYTFSRFYDEADIENNMDLEIQELLLEKVNELIDKHIIEIPGVIAKV